MSGKAVTVDCIPAWLVLGAATKKVRGEISHDGTCVVSRIGKYHKLTNGAVEKFPSWKIYRDLKQSKNL